MSTPREKSPLPEAQFRIEPATLHHAAHYQLNYSGPTHNQLNYSGPSCSVSHDCAWDDIQLKPGVLFLLTNLTPVPLLTIISFQFIFISSYSCWRFRLRGAIVHAMVTVRDNLPDIHEVKNDTIHYTWVWFKHACDGTRQDILSTNEARPGSRLEGHGLSQVTRREVVAQQHRDNRLVNSGLGVGCWHTFKTSRRVCT